MHKRGYQSTLIAASGHKRGLMSLPETNSPLTDTDDEITGLPMLPTWRKVYWFVLVVFVTYVVLLTALSRVFA
jgi:hypothetical protein